VSPDDQHDLDPALAGAVRRAYVRPVDEITAQRHVSAIVAAAARAGDAPAQPPRRVRRRVWQTVVATATTVLAVPVGMAAAGVTLPDAVTQPYRSIGIALPHQAREERSAPATPSVRPATTTAPQATSPATAGRRPHAAHGVSSTGTRPGAPTTPRSGTPGASKHPANGLAPARPGAGRPAPNTSKKTGGTLGPGHEKPLTPTAQATGQPKRATPLPDGIAPSPKRVAPRPQQTTSVPAASDAAPGHDR